jgi:hypothetical protein
MSWLSEVVVGGTYKNNIEGKHSYQTHGVLSRTGVERIKAEWTGLINENYHHGLLETSCHRMHTMLHPNFWFYTNILNYHSMGQKLHSINKMLQRKIVYKCVHLHASKSYNTVLYFYSVSIGVTFGAFWCNRVNAAYRKKISQVALEFKNALPDGKRLITLELVECWKKKVLLLSTKTIRFGSKFHAKKLWQGWGSL